MPEKITLGELKELIKEEKIHPSDLFGVGDLTGDPLVRGYLDSSIKELKGKLSGEYDARKRIEKDGDKTKDESSKELKEKDDLIKKLQIEGAKVKATELFGTKIKERKLDEKQSKFLKSKQGDFLPQDLEALEKEVDSFLDKRLDEYKETAKIFGVKTLDKSKEDEPKGGGEPGTGESSEDDELIPD